jgi:hypothetical protein
MDTIEALVKRLEKLEHRVAWFTEIVERYFASGSPPDTKTLKEISDDRNTMDN